MLQNKLNERNFDRYKINYNQRNANFNAIIWFNLYIFTSFVFQIELSINGCTEISLNKMLTGFSRTFLLE